MLGHGGQLESVFSLFKKPRMGKSDCELLEMLLSLFIYHVLSPLDLETFYDSAAMHE
jgi:hypothetical protein